MIFYRLFTLNILKIKGNFWCIEEFVETWGTSRRKNVINIIFRVGCMKCHNRFCFVSLCKKVVCSVQIVSVCIIALSLALMSVATVHRGWKKLLWLGILFEFCKIFYIICTLYILSVSFNSFFFKSVTLLSGLIIMNQIWIYAELIRRPLLLQKIFFDQNI